MSDCVFLCQHGENWWVTVCFCVSMVKIDEWLCVSVSAWWKLMSDCVSVSAWWKLMSDCVFLCQHGENWWVTVCFYVSMVKIDEWLCVSVSAWWKLMSDCVFLCQHGENLWVAVCFCVSMVKIDEWLCVSVSAWWKLMSGCVFLWQHGCGAQLQSRLCDVAAESACGGCRVPEITRQGAGLHHTYLWSFQLCK